jgi:hypothetical protein
MIRSASFVALGQGPEVVTDMRALSSPSAGVTVREPRLSAGGTALATPSPRDTDTAATTITTAAGTGRVNDLFLYTMRLTLFEK